MWKEKEESKKEAGYEIRPQLYIHKVIKTAEDGGFGALVLIQ